MSILPVISGKQCVKALEKVGFYVKRQSGSHIILRNDNPFCQITVPNHKTLDRGTLFNILKVTDLSVDKFKELM